MGLAGLAWALAGCADPCSDDGFGQEDLGSDCPAVGGGDETTGGPEDTDSTSIGPGPTSAGTQTGDSTSTVTETSEGTDTIGTLTDTSPATDSSTQTGTDGTATASDTDGEQTLWCTDADRDGFGDPDDCVSVAEDDRPPAGTVDNDEDCDDTSAQTFPGAAPNDDPDACMRDEDDDDFGDDDPPAAVTPGSDCDDLDAMVASGCFDCPAGQTVCQGDDVLQCNDNGTFGFPVQTCEYGCDDDAAVCWPELTVEALAGGQMCFEASAGEPVQLEAVTAGGDGNYAWQWNPAATLDDPSLQNPVATPDATTTYDVVVTDGEGNMAADAVTVYLAQTWNLAQDCEAFTFADPFDNAAAPDPNLQFFSQQQVVCQVASDAVPVAHVCAGDYDQTRITFRMQVVTFIDDDSLGFVWNWQDAGHFYVLHWKQTTQDAAFGPWPEGITIKRIEADDPADLTAADVFAPEDTPRSLVLATPETLYDQGWGDNEEYVVTLDLQAPEFTIGIRRFADDTLVAGGVVTDDAYAGGQIGSFSAGQLAACHGFFTSGCLP